MSAETKIRAGLEIQANVKGTQQIHQLADSIEAAGMDASKLREHGLALAQTWQQLESRKALIDHFKSLQTAADGLSDELKAAQEQSEKLKQAWQADKGNENAKMAYVRQAKAVSDLSNKQDELRQKLQHARAAMNDAGIAVKNLAKHEAQLAQESTAAQSKLAAFTREAEKLNKIAAAKRTLGLDIDDGVREQIKQVNQAFADLKQKGGLTQKELARAADLHRQKLKELETQLGQTGVGFSELAEEIGSVVGKAGGLAYVTKEAIAFESAMAGVKKVTDANVQQLEQLSGSLKNMAGELGIMPAELAKIAAAGGQMGVAFERLPEFTKMAAQMANAFGITSDQAGDAAAKISNVYQLSIEQMQELGDAINTLGNTTAAKEAEITEVLLRIGGNAKQFGLLKEEAAALSAALISLGKTPETAGTAINALLTKLQTAPVQTDKFKNSLQQLGLSAEQMAANIQANPQAALTDFLKRLEQVDKQSRAIMLAEMFGAEYSDDLALLTGSLKTYSAALDTATDKARTHGAMQKEAAAALDTAKGKIDQAKAAVSATAASLGETLLPVLRVGAEAVGGMAKSIQLLTEQFPLLTQLAVGIAAAKVAVAAYQTAMKMAGKDSVRAMEDTDKSIKKVRGSLKGASDDAKRFGREMNHAGKAGRFAGIGEALGGIGGKLDGLIQKAGMLTAAFTGGFAIGDAMYQEFEWVRTVGDELGRLVAYTVAIFSDDTWENVSKNYKTSKELAKETAEAQKQAAAAAKKRAEAEKKAAESQAANIQTLQARHRSLNQEYQAVTGSMKTLAAAGKENSAMYRDLAARQTELGIKVQETGAQLKKLNAQIGDTGPLAESKKALEALGLTAEQVSTGISDKAQAAIKDFELAAAQFGNDAQQMERIFNAALSKMDGSPEAAEKLTQSLEKVGHQAGLSAEQIRKIADAAPETADKVAEAFEKIGVDVQAVTQGISAEAGQAFKDFQAASAAAKDAGINDSRLLAASFEQMMGKLKSPEEFAEFKKRLEESGQAALLTKEQMARLNTAVKNGATAAATAYGRLADAVKKAGDGRAAEAAGKAAEAAMKRGEISAAQYKQVLEAVKQRTEELAQQSAEAGRKAAESHQKAAAAAQKQAAATTEQAQTAKAAADVQTAAADQTTAATERGTAAVREQSAALSSFGQHLQNHWQQLQWQGKAVGSMADAVVRAMVGAAQYSTGAWDDYVARMWAAHDRTRAAVESLNAATDSGADIARNLAHAEALARANADKLDKASLANLHAAIDKARQKMQALADDAKKTREDLQASLDELNGDSDAGARLAQQRKIAELRKKQEQAERTGNRDAAADYGQSIALQQQLWQRQQAKKAEEAARQQREAEERAEQERQREAERQRQEAERRQQEIRLPETPQVSVNIDHGRLQQLFGQVANAGAEQVLTLLEQAQKRSQ